MQKHGAILLIPVLLLSACTLLRNSKATDMQNTPEAQTDGSGQTQAGQPKANATAADPKTPQDYLATSVARDDWEFPLSEPSRYQQPYRPQYHFSPAGGWLGDPDGMVRFQDLYHVFWWGHAESKDLVHWNERLQPMVGDDRSFVYYSGSVVVDLENTSGFAVDPQQPPMIAIYTMHDKGSNEETQGLSISYDYKTFIYYDQNPVLDSERPAFRDPQVFYDASYSRWIMVITLSDDRKVSFYASTDLKHWEHLSDFGPVGAQSQVWEVPDIFPLTVDGDPNHKDWVLLCGMGPNRVQYFIGDFDGKSFTLKPELNGYLLRGEGLPGEVFADFENGLPEGWLVEGDDLTLGEEQQPGSQKTSGFLGAFFLSTFTPGTETGNRGKTQVHSPVFQIEKKYINFLISGGKYNNQSSVSLLVDGEPVRTASGEGAGEMKWASWDVSDLRGKDAQIRIRDDVTNADYGHVNIDHILFSDSPALSGQEHANWLDYGADYYAVRTYRDYDNAENRTVTMGWMGNWEYASDVPTSWGKGALALPREIALVSFAGGLRIVQRPIPALEGLRQAPVRLERRQVVGSAQLSEFRPLRNTYEIDATFEIDDPAARFGLKTVVNGSYHITVGYDAPSATLFLDRTSAENGGFNGRFAKFLTAPLEPVDGKIRLHIFVDQSSIEVFANDGLVTMTGLILPGSDSLGIELFSENGAASLLELTAWELDSIWDLPPQ